ncbi:hypothetical protein LTR95_013119 [Oleoguttula sp. CCFEE 5521]
MDRSFQAKDDTPSKLIMNGSIIETPQAADLDPQISSLSLPLNVMQMTSGSRDEDSSTPPRAATPRDTDGAPKAFVSAEELTDLFNDTEKSLCYDGSFKLVDSPVSARPELLLDSVLKKRHIHGYRVRSGRDNAADGDDNEKYEVVYEPIPGGLPGNDRWEDSYLCDGSRAFVDGEYYSIDRWWRFHPVDFSFQMQLSKGDGANNYQQAKHDRKYDQPGPTLQDDYSNTGLGDLISCPGSNHLLDQARYIESWETHLTKGFGRQKAVHPAPAQQDFAVGMDVYLNDQPRNQQGSIWAASYERRVRAASLVDNGRKYGYALSKRDDVAWVDDGKRFSADVISPQPKYKVVKEAS